MSKYAIFLSKKAQRQLDKLPDSIALQIIEVVQDLENDPMPLGQQKVKRAKWISN